MSEPSVPTLPQACNRYAEALIRNLTGPGNAMNFPADEVLVNTRLLGVNFKALVDVLVEAGVISAASLDALIAARLTALAEKLEARTPKVAVVNGRLPQ